MKVAYLFSRYPVPSQTFCDTEMRALEAAGFEVEICSCSPPTSGFRHGADERPRGPVFHAPPGAALEWIEAAARREERWPGGMVADHEARYGARYDPARRARHAVYFADLLRRRGVEHLHVHFANRATHAALFIHALTGMPFSFTAHAQDFLVDLGSDALLGEMCARASFVVAVSDWSRRALIERCPEAAAKIHRVYNGLPLDRWLEPGAGEVAAAPPLRIFSVGRLVEFKGFDDLIEACAGLKSRAVAFRCEIAGEGPWRDVLAGRIEQTGVGDCVKLAGLLPQTEIRARLAACDVFALPCRVDGKGACDVLPTVILEAMAAGRPVVSTRLAGVPEMVEDGRTGRLVAPGDVPALTDALDALGRDPALRQRLGHAGRLRLEAGFSSAGTTRQLASLFTGTAGGTAARAVAPPPAGPGTVCLFDRWPYGFGDGFDAALLSLRDRRPNLRLVALTPGTPPTADAEHGASATFALAPAFEFLPDAMVLEGEWRERSADAHRVEGWRGSLGGGPEETDEFLLAARRALYLYRHWLARGETAAHLHAVGPKSLRCAWVLLRLGAAHTGSFFLAPGETRGRGGLGGAASRRLAAAFLHGWAAGEHKLAAALGPGFHGEDGPVTPAEWERWTERVEAFCGGI